MDISCCQRSRLTGRGVGVLFTGGDEEKPADDVDADVQIAAALEEVDTDRGKTKRVRLKLRRENGYKSITPMTRKML